MSILTNTTTSDLTSTQPDYSVAAAILDSPTTNGLRWNNPNFPKYLGYFKSIAPLHRAIIALSTWVAGKGYNCSPATEIALDHITGMGHDSFQSIMENHTMMESLNGDAYCEIIREDPKDVTSKLLNLKPLNPSRVTHVIQENGLIDYYEVRDGAGDVTKIQPYNMFHTSIDRFGDEVHGGSVVEACQWVIDAWMEVTSDYRKVLHRNINPLKIVELDASSSAKFTELKTNYQTMTKDYETLFVVKGNMVVTVPAVPLQDPMAFIQYLESLFYQVVGVPRVIATSENSTEANSKLGYLTFEPVYTRRQGLLEQAIWNQLGLIVSFNKPDQLAGLKSEEQSNQQANTGQLSMQPSDMAVQAGRQ